MKKLAGKKIDLEQIFESEKNIRLFPNCSIERILSQNLDEKEYTVVGQDNAAVYMTMSGARYHRADCPYCKGKTLTETTISMMENIGMKPCKCIGAEKEKKLTLPETLPVQEKRYVTAFVDESIRTNPWHTFDEMLPEKQATYSYIICNGLLQTEDGIANDNILYTGVEQASDMCSTSNVAIEAILAVLFKLAVNGYRDNVLIYTDNSGAKNSWYQSKASKNLAKLFASVIVCQIPREKNAVADSLGRERVIVNLPVRVVESVLGCERT